MTLIERDADAAVRSAQTEAAFAFVAALVNKPPEAAVSATDNNLQYIGGHQDGVGTTYHESGTLRLGDDPDGSVTDVHGHFHHVTNAFCVDQSIFPTVGSANPVPTGLALSNLIATHIVSRFTSSPLVRFHFQFYAVRSHNDNYEEYLYRLIPNVEDLDEVGQAVSSTDMDDWIVVGVRTCGETFGDLNADPHQRESSSISVNPFGGAGDDVYFDGDGREIRIPKVFVADSTLGFIRTNRSDRAALDDAQTGQCLNGAVTRPESASCVSMSIPSPLAFQRSLTRLCGQCLCDSSSRNLGWRDCYAAGAIRRTFCCNRTGVRNDNFHRHLAVLRLHRGRDHPRHPAAPWATIFSGPAQCGRL